MRSTYLALALSISMIPMSWAEISGNTVVKDIGPALEGILQEAHRQERVSGEMSSMLRDFQNLVQDLDSNGLLPEANGDDLIGMAETIDSTDRENVRVAAQRLREAGTDRQGREENLDAAEQAIEGALAQLRALLSEANALRAGELVANELMEIIRLEEAVNAKTITVGGEMLNGVDNLSFSMRVLSDEQERIGTRADGLESIMADALKEDMDPTARAKLQGALDIMQRERVRGRLAVAANSIAKADPMHAVDEQNKALAALREMVRMMRPEDQKRNELLTAREEIRAILKDQKNLREQVDAKTQQRFEKDAPELLMKQRELRKRLEAALKAMQKSQAKQPVNAKKPDDTRKDGKAQAGKTKKKAGEGTVKGKTKKVVKAPAVPSKMKGESSSGTGKASENNAPQQKKPEEGGSDAGKKQGQAAEKPMHVAEDELAKKQQQQTTQAQREAEKELAKMMRELSKQMMAQKFPEMSPEDLDNMMDLQAQAEEMQEANDPSLQEALEKALAELAAAQKAAEPGPPKPGKPGPPKPGKPMPPKKFEKGKPSKKPSGPRPFVKMAVEGEAPESRNSSWASLSMEERDALGDNFARELPREYRQMLRAYYETLAKE